MSKDPETWDDDAFYQKLKASVSKMKVINDCAERGIALIEKYNESLTKNGEQKQFLLRFAQRHRQRFPTPSKEALMKDAGV